MPGQGYVIYSDIYRMDQGREDSRMDRGKDESLDMYAQEPSARWGLPVKYVQFQQAAIAATFAWERLGGRECAPTGRMEDDLFSLTSHTWRLFGRCDANKQNRGSKGWRREIS